MNKSYDTYPLLTKVTDLKGSMFRLFGNVFFYIVFRLETIRVSSKFVVRRKWPVLIFGQVLTLRRHNPGYFLSWCSSTFYVTLYKGYLWRREQILPNTALRYSLYHIF
jgi:hypothetical protein